MLRKLLVSHRKHQGAPTFGLLFKANAVSKQNVDIYTGATYVSAPSTAALKTVVCF